MTAPASNTILCGCPDTHHEQCWTSLPRFRPLYDAIMTVVLMQGSMLESFELIERCEPPRDGWPPGTQGYPYLTCSFSFSRQGVVYWRLVDVPVGQAIKSLEHMAIELQPIVFQGVTTDWKSWASELAEALERVASSHPGKNPAAFVAAGQLLKRFRAGTPCPHGFTRPTCGQCQ